MLFEFIQSSLEPANVHKYGSFGYILEKSIDRINSCFLFFFASFNTSHICDHNDLNLGIINNIGVLLEPFRKLSS